MQILQLYLYSQENSTLTPPVKIYGDITKGLIKEKIIHKNCKKKKGSFFSNSNELGAQKAQENKNKEASLEIALRIQNIGFT